MWKDGQIDPDRYTRMLDARAFFFECLNARAPYVAVENPLPMARAQLPQPSCFIQPSWFGVKYTKKTLYWLRNLPPIMAGTEYPNPKQFVRCSSGHYRARTFPQVAHALASQWSDYIIRDITTPNHSGHTAAPVVQGSVVQGSVVQGSETVPQR